MSLTDFTELRKACAHRPADEVASVKLGVVQRFCAKRRIVSNYHWQIAQIHLKQDHRPAEEVTSIKLELGSGAAR